MGRHIRNVKVTPQKNILGIDTEILPNIYDIEPNNEYEKNSLPQRMRYYHGLIDTQLLSAGSGYENLPNVVIFIILPYDPFDQNRMVYTVRNLCEEDPLIPYNDGAKKIFLYTRGKKGNASQSLKDMLKYIQESKDNNVTNQDIASIQELVNKVKHKKDVGINYMKSWEYEKMMHDKAFDSGYNNGSNADFNDGFNDGFNKATDRLNQLTILLSKAGRSEDIVKAALDKKYQEKLFEKFCL